MVCFFGEFVVVGGSSLFVVGRPLSGVYCLLVVCLIVVVRCSLFLVCCLLFVGFCCCCLVVVDCRPLSGAFCSLFCVRVCFCFRLVLFMVCSCLSFCCFVVVEGVVVLFVFSCCCLVVCCLPFVVRCLSCVI